MITDAQLTYADNQAVTVTAASANQIDTTTARNLERSGARAARIVALVTTAFAGGTSLQVTIRQSAAADMSSPDILFSGPVVALAALLKGAVLLDTPIPSPAGVTPKRYWDVNFVVVGTMTAGAAWVGIVLDDEGGQLSLGQIGR